MKRWNIDRVTVFLFVSIVSFLYDLAFYLGIRDTSRFPHPFVYFRSLGDVEYLRGFPGMLRQAMFALVAGGLVGWGISVIVLKNAALTRVTIRFLRIFMWFPLIVVFAVPDTFKLGITVALLATIYHYLTARSLLEFSNRDAFSCAAGEVTLQTLFFTLIAQIWVRRWDWIIFPATSNTAMGFAVFGLILVLMLLINWIFRANFFAGCDRRAALHIKELRFLGESSYLGITLLTVVWLLLWQLTCVALGFDDGTPIAAIREMTTFLFAYDAWENILTSLAEIAGGILLGSLLALAVSFTLHTSEAVRRVVTKLLPTAYLSPIALWLLVLHFVILFSPTSSFQSFIPGAGHKIMGVGLLTFFPLLQALWGLRDETPVQRFLIAIDDALPIAFVAMLFGELWAATAGLGFLMTVASATYQYQRGLAAFFLTAMLFVALSMCLRFGLATLQVKAVQT